MKPEVHGGNRRTMAALSGRNLNELLDFSVNIRPEGVPDFLRAAVLRATSSISAYPSPHAEEAAEAASQRHGLPAECFAFGNGSNDLIHALARALAKRGVPEVYIVEPAFSEYALACRLAGLDVHHIWGGLEASPFPSLAEIPAGAAVFLANPGNPSGLLLSAVECQSLLTEREDLLWIFDEAFIDYAGPENEISILGALPPNGVVLRSLTKFYALPGVRLGYLATAQHLAQAIRVEIPAWSVNAFAVAAAVAVLKNCSSFATQTRAENALRRTNLASALITVPGIQVYPSAANYILFRWPEAPKNLYTTLLQNYGIVIRDCSNYYGLEDGTWFRVAVRFPEEHQQLAAALRHVQRHLPDGRSRRGYVSSPASSHKTPAIMLQGTSSNAGKSILTAAFCRIFRQDGYDVAPFKAQNMSLNSGVTLDGKEMGRAQIVQAQAACIDPDVRMNPILLKPHSDTGSQVIVLGEPLGHMSVQKYFREKEKLWSTVTAAYTDLCAEHEIMVLEGAGSPGEINLKKHDLVNMHMAAHAQANVLLVGDIDRGGIYASFLGTWLTFTESERRLLAGWLVNRFRGDASLLIPAHQYMFEHTGVPVLGTIPWIPELSIPEEDMAGFWATRAVPIQAGTHILDIAVIVPAHVSNYTDFAPLALEPDVCLRPVRSLEEWGNPDVVILPGSKNVPADLEILRQSGLAAKIITHAQERKWILGICGGLQMMGKSIYDPAGVESPITQIAGLGLMDLHSTFAQGKTLLQVERAETPLGVPTCGYEIHHGSTIHGPSALPLFRRARQDHIAGSEEICGYTNGRCWATYLHGIFDDDTFRRAWLDYVRTDLNMPPGGYPPIHYDVEHELDRLADTVREHVDMKTIYRIMGLQ